MQDQKQCQNSFTFSSRAVPVSFPWRQTSHLVRICHLTSLATVGDEGWPFSDFFRIRALRPILGYIRKWNANQRSPSQESTSFLIKWWPCQVAFLPQPGGVELPSASGKAHFQHPGRSVMGEADVTRTGALRCCKNDSLNSQLIRWCYNYNFIIRIL